MLHLFDGAVRNARLQLPYRLAERPALDILKVRLFFPHRRFFARRSGATGSGRHKFFSWNAPAGEENFAYLWAPIPGTIGK